MYTVYTENVCHICGQQDFFMFLKSFFMLTKTALLDQNREKNSSTEKYYYI